MSVLDIESPFKVPSNFEEAKQKFTEMYDDGTSNGKGIAACMTGILYCRLKRDEEFYKAYENTLKDYLRIVNDKERDANKETTTNR